MTRARKDIIKRLREAIGDRHGQQRAFSARTGISESTLSLILSGVRRPSLDVAVQLEAATGIPAREFAAR